MDHLAVNCAILLESGGRISFPLIFLAIDQALEKAVDLHKHRRSINTVHLFIDGRLVEAPLTMVKKSLPIHYAFIIIIFYAFLAYGRNMVWLDEYSLWYNTTINSPAKVRPHLNLANALLIVGLPEQAIEEYKIVIEKDPKHFSAYIGLGSTYLVMKNWDESIIEFNKALSIQPDSSIAHTNLGIAYMNSKRINMAIEEFKTAIKLWPDNDLAQQNLGLAYKQSGF